MNITRSPAGFLSLMTVCSVLLSCTNDLATSNDFLIKIDSIHIPVAVSANTPFDVEFFGTVGFNGCFSFKSFDNKFENDEISIEAWGTYDNRSGVCPTVMVYLSGQKLNMTIPLPGIYKIIIKEPDYSLILKRITVN